MSRNKTKKYEGSEHELRAQTLELDELHHDVGMPAMAEALGEMRGTSRRTFLMGAGAAVAGGAALAVGSGAVPTWAAASTRRLSQVNAAVRSLGGKSQTKPDPAFVPVVKKAVAGLGSATPAQGALGVVALALELENIAAETYVKDTVLAKKESNKALLASIMGIEAQHVATLLAVQALLMAGAPQLISLAPGTAAMLPAAAGSVGFPNAFYKTNSAAPAGQGAVK